MTVVCLFCDGRCDCGCESCTALKQALEFVSETSIGCARCAKAGQLKVSPVAVFVYCPECHLFEVLPRFAIPTSLTWWGFWKVSL